MAATLKSTKEPNLARWTGAHSTQAHNHNPENDDEGDKQSIFKRDLHEQVTSNIVLANLSGVISY